METLVMTFNSFADAAACAEKIFETTLLPAAVEVFSGNTFALLGLQGAAEAGGKGYALAVAMEAFAPAVARMKREIVEMGRSCGATGDEVFAEEAHTHFWLKVSDLNAALAAKASGGIATKLNYPISEWKDLIAFAQDVLARGGLEFALQAHAGNGVSFFNLLTEKGDAKAMENALVALNVLLGRCREIGGNVVVQRAPAELKGKLKVWGDIGSDFVAMKRVKEELDPSGIMNPGRYAGGL